MNIITIFFTLSGVVLSGIVYYDTIKNKQSMPIMNIVWTLTMLWASWIGFIAYISFGRQKGNNKSMIMDSTMDMSHNNMVMSDTTNTKKHKWQGIALSTLHCGAGCSLADIIGESVSGGLGLSLYMGWGIDYILALMIGVYFQYMAIQQMGRVKSSVAFRKAVKSDLLSLTAWQIGMYGFMAIYIICFAENGVDRISFEFWFMMQIAMIAGFIVAYPMNILLIKLGLKHSM